MIRDSIGNEIVAGSLMFWKGANAVVQVLEIREGTKGFKDKPPVKGSMDIGIRFTLEPVDPNVLDQFVVVVNPVEVAKTMVMLADAKGAGPQIVKPNGKPVEEITDGTSAS